MARNGLTSSGLHGMTLFLTHPLLASDRPLLLFFPSFPTLKPMMREISVKAAQFLQVPVLLGAFQVSHAVAQMMLMLVRPMFLS